MKRSRESEEGEEGEEGEVAGGGPPALKAQVTETNGEISCTIEETNRLRALLGLRPLNVGAPSKERQAVENFRAKREEEDKAREAREIAERLEKAREKRLLQSKLSGPGLGEVDGEGEGELLSAADWVKRSRKVEISHKEKSLALAKKLEQEEREMLQHKQQQQQQQRQQSSSYTSADLQGLSIMHSAEELAQGPGQEIILTLADTSVLDKDERGRAKGLLDGDDVLENVNLADASRKAERDKIIKKAKQPAYSGYDDAEFEPGAVAGIRPSILPQYDKAKKQRPKLVLGEGGAVGQADHNASSDEIPMDVTTVLPQSLRVDLKDADDYYSKAEYSTFHKPKKVNGEKKQKRLRKKEESSAADGDVIDMAVTGGTSIEGGSGSASLESLLRQSGAVSSEGQDRRLRDQSTEGGKDDEERRRRAAYEAAVNRAEDKTQSALGLSRSSLAVSAVNNEPEDDDADIAQSLARVRRLALQQQRQAQTEDQSHGGQGGDSASLSVLDSGAQWSKQRVAQLNSAAAAAAAAANESKFDESAASTILSVDGRKADGTLVFSDTTEFTARMQAQLSEAARSRAEAVVKASERQMHQQRSEAGAASAAATSATGAEDDSDNDDEQHGMDVESSAAASAPGSTILTSEPVAAIGLAATLALLKNTGELQAEEKLVGRAKDTRAADPSAKDFNVKIEYRDETGRKLTQKEAFRQINYQFHGIAPSKKKQEKRQKQLQLEDRAGSSKVVTGQGGTMRSLVQAQQATGSAFITIGGGAGAGAGGKLELGAIGGSSGGPTLTAAEIAAQLYAKQKAHEEKKAEAAEAALQQQTKVNVKSDSRKQAR